MLFLFLIAKLVSEQHFGGFLKKRSAADEDSKSWKEKMEDLITKSKKAKVISII